VTSKNYKFLSGIRISFLLKSTRYLRFLFLGSEGLFSPCLPLKVQFFLLHAKFSIDGYITRPYWFWAPNSVLGLWGPIFAFLTPKSTYFLHIYKISDRLMGHMTYFIFELRTLSIKLHNILGFKILEIWLSFCSKRKHVTYMTLSIWKRTSFWIDLLGSQPNFFWIFLDYFYELCSTRFFFQNLFITRKVR
jgi:hypothetical protein